MTTTAFAKTTSLTFVRNANSPSDPNRRAYFAYTYLPTTDALGIREETPSTYETGLYFVESLGGGLWCVSRHTGFKGQYDFAIKTIGTFRSLSAAKKVASDDYADRLAAL